MAAASRSMATAEEMESGSAFDRRWLENARASETRTLSATGRAAASPDSAARLDQLGRASHGDGGPRQVDQEQWPWRTRQTAKSIRRRPTWTYLYAAAGSDPSPSNSRGLRVGEAERWAWVSLSCIAPTLRYGSRGAPHGHPSTTSSHPLSEAGSALLPDLSAPEAHTMTLRARARARSSGATVRERWSRGGRFDAHCALISPPSAHPRGSRVLLHGPPPRRLVCRITCWPATSASAWPLEPEVPGQRARCELRRRRRGQGVAEAGRRVADGRAAPADWPRLDNEGWRISDSALRSLLLPALGPARRGKWVRSVLLALARIRMGVAFTVGVGPESTSADTRGSSPPGTPHAYSTTSRSFSAVTLHSSGGHRIGGYPRGAGGRRGRVARCSLAEGPGRRFLHSAASDSQSPARSPRARPGPPA